MNYYSAIAFIFFLYSQHLAFAHSFLSCTHRLVDGTCLGYPRGFAVYDLIKAGYVTETKVAKTFVKPSLPENLQSVDWSTYYNEKYPMPVAKAGQNITLQWAAFNHGLSMPYKTVMDPPGVLQVFKNPNINPLSDVSPDVYKTNVIGGGWFKHCGASSSTQDEMCATTINVGTSPGVNSFLWFWQFNDATEVYTTAFEVYVTDDIANIPSSLQSIVRTDGFGLGGQNTTISNVIPRSLQTQDATPGTFTPWMGSPLAQMVKNFGRAVISADMKQLAMSLISQDQADQMNSNVNYDSVTASSIAPTNADTTVAIALNNIINNIAPNVACDATGNNLVSGYTGSSSTGTVVLGASASGTNSSISVSSGANSGGSAAATTTVVSGNSSSSNQPIVVADASTSNAGSSTPVISVASTTLEESLNANQATTNSGYPTPSADTSNQATTNSGYPIPSADTTSSKCANRKKRRFMRK